MKINIIGENKEKVIPYEIVKNKICFDDELTLNLEKLQRDYDVTVDVVKNSFGMLITSVGEDLGRYVAQVFIPSIEYVFIESATELDEDENPIVNKVAKDFNIEDCTLTLWSEV